MEEWKEIPGFEGYYEASNLGRIRSLDRYITLDGRWGKYTRFKPGKVMTPKFDGKRSYLMVMLSKDCQKKKYLVHRLVAMTFLKNPNGFSEINHKDEDKTNNSVANLEWCTHKYNSNYGKRKYSSHGENNSQNKFSEEMIRKIKSEYIKGDPEFGTVGLAKKYNVSPSHISSIIHGRRWGWLEC